MDLLNLLLQIGQILSTELFEFRFLFFQLVVLFQHFLHFSNKPVILKITLHLIYEYFY